MQRLPVETTEELRSKKNIGTVQILISWNQVKSSWNWGANENLIFLI